MYFDDTYQLYGKNVGLRNLLSPGWDSFRKQDMVRKQFVHSTTTAQSYIILYSCDRKCLNPQPPSRFRLCVNVKVCLWSSFLEQLLRFHHVIDSPKIFLGEIRSITNAQGQLAPCTLAPVVQQENKGPLLAACKLWLSGENWKHWTFRSVNLFVHIPLVP